RKRPFALVRNVQITGHIEAGRTLKDDLFDSIFVSLNNARSARLKRRALGHRIESQHVKQLTANLRSFSFPIGQRVNGCQASFGYSLGLATNVLDDGLKAAIFGPTGNLGQHEENDQSPAQLLHPASPLKGLEIENL